MDSSFSGKASLLSSTYGYWYVLCYGSIQQLCLCSPLAWNYLTQSLCLELLSSHLSSLGNAFRLSCLLYQTLMTVESAADLSVAIQLLFYITLNPLLLSFLCSNSI